ncbi:hypothetical protein AB0B57_12735 [Micromonospora sp. NPDC049101]|uniref:hypothetical protein n=1 Tax=Micromonospora sp. NPDC049101 TaxID=3155032 RepID=UPI0033CB3BA7
MNVTAQQVGASVGVAALVVVAATTTVNADGQAGVLHGYHVAYVVAAVACVLGAVLVGLVPSWERGASADAESPRSDRAVDRGTAVSYVAIIVRRQV